VTRTKIFGLPVVAAHSLVHARSFPEHRRATARPPGAATVHPPAHSAACDQRGRRQDCLACPSGTPTSSPMLLILRQPKLIGLYDGDEDVQSDTRLPGGDDAMGLWDLRTDQVPEKAFPGGDTGVVEGRHCIPLYALPSTCQPRFQRGCSSRSRRENQPQDGARVLRRSPKHRASHPFDGPPAGSPCRSVTPRQVAAVLSPKPLCSNKHE
jgi:hypothetical protein